MFQKLPLAFGLAIGFALGAQVSESALAIDAQLEQLAAQAQQAQTAGDYRRAAANYQEILKLRPHLAEVRANLGLMHHLLGEYPEAIRDFEAALREKPQLILPNLFLGLDLVRFEQPRRALPYLERAERLNPRDPQAALGLAQAYVALRDFKKANEYYFRAVEIMPKDVEAWYGLGVTYLDLEESAVEQLRKANPRGTYFQTLLAESLERQGKTREAIDLYRKLLPLSPAPPCLHAALGFAYVEQGDFSAAEREFQADLEQRSACLPARLGLVRVFIERGNIEGALKELDAISKADRNFLRANAGRLWQGLPPQKAAVLERQPAERTTGPTSPALSGNQSSPAELYAQGHYTLCAERLASGRGPLPVADRLLLAQCAYDSGDYRAAFVAAGRLLEAIPRSESGLYWQAKSAEELAISTLEKASLAEPGSPRTHLLLAEAFRQNQNFKEAEAEYRKAIQLKPDELIAHLGLATVYFRLLELDKAVPELEKVFELGPADPEASNLMGQILFFRHQYAEAIPYLKTALQGPPDTAPHIHALLGKIYAVQGRTIEGVEELKKSLPADQDGSYHFQLYLLYKKLGDPQAATLLRQSEALRQRTREQVPPNASR